MWGTELVQGVRHTQDARVRARVLPWKDDLL